VTGAGEVVPVHMILLETGQVLAWDGQGSGLNSETVYDPETNSFAAVPSGLNFFCAAITTTATGKALIFGGHVSSWAGTTNTTTFDGSTLTWGGGASMNRSRWYATATTLADGRVLVLSGDDLSRDDTLPITPISFRSQTIPEVFDPFRNRWTRLDAAERRMPTYPFMMLLPDGRLLNAGPGKATLTLDVDTGAWTTVATSAIDGGSAVMYRPGKVLKAGGWRCPTGPTATKRRRAALRCST
jgi:hypothetical protein